VTLQGQGHKLKTRSQQPCEIRGGHNGPQETTHILFASSDITV